MNKLRAFPIAFALLCLLVGLLLNHAFFIRSEQHRQDYFRQLLGDQVRGIEAELGKAVAATELLKWSVVHHNGDTRDFVETARGLLANLPVITNLQLSPAGIVTLIYPLAGQEAALGHNILQDDKRKGEAIAAINANQVTVAGPFGLVQGGQGILVRNPVFLNRAGAEQFWGFASALIMLDQLLDVVKINDLASLSSGLSLSRLDPLSGRWENYYRQGSNESEGVLSMPIRLPNGQWQLQVHYPSSHLFSYVLGLALAGLFALLCYHYLRQSMHRSVAVTRQTNDNALMDEVCGIHNRRWMVAEIDRAIARCRAGKQSAALILIDFDDFKVLNDSLGHDVGDRLLQAKAKALLALVDNRGAVARLGGDEFAVLYTDSPDRNLVSARAHRLLDCLNREVDLGVARLGVHATVVVTLLPTDAENANEALKNLDIAHFHAKKFSKNNVSFFSASQRDEAMERILISQELKAAISDNQFILHWQPIVNLADGRITGHEALVRWQHPQRGLIYPDRFIELAEDTGLIVPLGYAILRQCAEQVRRFHDQHQCESCNHQTMSVSVNLSPRQLRDPALVRNISRILDEYSLSPSVLKIEITETALMESPAEALPLLHSLRNMGISIALDDFGTGYSSLWMLRRLPIDLLKIDRSFVTGIAANKDDREIIAAVVGLAHKLGMEVIAEGIEELGQLDILQKLGCEKGQGYYFARPAASTVCISRPCLIAMPSQRRAAITLVRDDLQSGLSS